MTGADIVPTAGVTIHNPDLHIATLSDKGKLDMELVVERGRGFRARPRHESGGCGDWPYPDGRHLLAGAESLLQGGGHPR